MRAFLQKLLEMLSERRQVRIPTPQAEELIHLAVPIKVELREVSTTEEGVEINLSVRRESPAALLFYAPVLVDEEGNVYQVDSESLERAKLDLVEREAEITLVFTPAPVYDACLTVIFNPASTEADPVAPKLEVQISP